MALLITKFCSDISGDLQLYLSTHIHSCYFIVTKYNHCVYSYWERNIAIIINIVISQLQDHFSQAASSCQLPEQHLPSMYRTSSSSYSSFTTTVAAGPGPSSGAPALKVIVAASPAF